MEKLAKVKKKGQIFVLTIDDENEDPKTVIVYNQKLKVSKNAHNGIEWTVSNFTGRKLQVCVKNIQPENPFVTAPPFCTTVNGSGGTGKIKSPDFRPDAPPVAGAPPVTYTYDIETLDQSDNVIAANKLPFTTNRRKGSTTVDPELELDL